jgi:hypothetical protein
VGTIECFSARIIVGSDDATLMARCVESLRANLCSSNPCSGKAYWFVTAIHDCLVLAGGEPKLGEPSVYGRVYEYSIVAKCTKPVELVKTLSTLLNSLEACKGMRVRLERA